MTKRDKQRQKLISDDKKRVNNDKMRQKNERQRQETIYHDKKQ